MVTHAPYSTSAGASPVPYLTGAFAGSGQFSVSPILGYQAGGLNLDGTPNTTSRQFQAGLSVTGKGASQNATLFVMTSAISNAPNIGFTQAGGFTGSTMNNSAGWYGLANGALSSATPTTTPNTVPTRNGVPIAGYVLNNTTTNLNHRSCVERSLLQLCPNRSGELYVQSNHDWNADDLGEQPSDFVAERLCRRTDGDGVRRFNAAVYELYETLCHNQPHRAAWRRRHLSARQFKRDACHLQCRQRQRAERRHDELHVCLRKSEWERPKWAERSARHVCQSVEFRGKGRGGVRQRGQYSCLVAQRPALGLDRRLLQSADGYGRQRRREYVGISDLDFLRRRYPLRLRVHEVGFVEHVQRRKHKRSTRVRGSRRSAALGRRRSDDARQPSDIGTATYNGHAIANIASGVGGQTYLAAGTVLRRGQLRRPQRVMVTMTGLDGTDLCRNDHMGSRDDDVRNAAGSLAWEWRRADRDAERLVLPGRSNQTPVYGEMGGSLILNGTGDYLGSGIFAARGSRNERARRTDPPLNRARRSAARADRRSPHASGRRRKASTPWVRCRSGERARSSRAQASALGRATRRRQASRGGTG